MGKIALVSLTLLAATASLSKAYADDDLYNAMRQGEEMRASGATGAIAAPDQTAAPAPRAQHRRKVSKHVKTHAHHG